MSAIVDRLSERVRTRPEDAAAFYELAVVLMNPGEQRPPSETSRQHARELLARTVQLEHDFAPAHALLAYVLLELDDSEAALVSLRRAVDLCPDNETFQDFLLESLDRAGRDRDLQTQLKWSANRRQVDLAALRDELRAAGLPADASTVRQNAFPAGERHFVSGLIDEADTIELEHSGDAPVAKRLNERQE